MGLRVSFWVIAGALYNRTHNNWFRWSTFSGECDRWPHTISAGIQSLLDHPRCIARCLLFQDGARGWVCRVSLLVSFYLLLFRNYLPDYRTYYMLRFVFVTCELCRAILAETTEGRACFFRSMVSIQMVVLAVKLQNLLLSLGVLKGNQVSSRETWLPFTFCALISP